MSTTGDSVQCIMLSLVNWLGNVHAIYIVVLKGGYPALAHHQLNVLQT